MSVPIQERSSAHVEPFSIRLDEQVLSGLKARIRNTRWPDQAAGAAWEQGTDLGYLIEELNKSRTILRYGYPTISTR